MDGRQGIVRHFSGQKQVAQVGAGVLAAGAAVAFGIERPLVVRDARGAWTAGFRALRASMGMP